MSTKRKTPKQTRKRFDTHRAWTIVADVIRILTPFLIWWLEAQHHVTESGVAVLWV